MHSVHCLAKNMQEMFVKRELLLCRMLKDRLGKLWFHFLYFCCYLSQIKIFRVMCDRYESRAETCHIWFMFYVNSSTAGDRLSYNCRGDGVTDFTRQLLDRRTTRLLSQMNPTDEVYSVKRRRRRSDDSQSFSTGVDPLDTNDPVSSLLTAPGDVKLDADDNGSGEFSHEVMPPAQQIDKDAGDNFDSDMLPSTAESEDTDSMSPKSRPRQTQMVPYASVILPQQSGTLRMFHLNY